MTERRVAEVVGKASGGYNLAQRVKFVRPWFSFVPLLQHKRSLVGKRASYTGYFDAVGQSVVYKYASRQGEYLSFVLQPPERRGEYQSVVVACKIRALSFAVVAVLLKPETGVAYKSVPFHHAAKIAIKRVLESCLSK